MKNTNIYSILLALALLPIACSQQETNKSSLHEAWNNKNDPKLFGYDYIKRKYDYTNNFKDLPLEAKLTKRPWSGDYWPTYKGGITYRWNDDCATDNQESCYGYKMKNFNALTEAEIRDLSPAEKYDLFIGAESYPLTNYERKRTRIMKTIPSNSEYDKDFEIPTWEGLCHAWAPATILYDNPAPVTMTSKKGIKIPFGSSDIKALLTYHLHTYAKTVRTKFLGGRCNTDFGKLWSDLNKNKISKEEFRDELHRAGCNDVNAGAFHIVLANQIALKNQGFIADVTRDLQVWNQAIEGYSSRIVEEKMGASDTAAPGTVKEITLETTMYYTTEIAHSWEKVAPADSTAEKHYKYRLELDANDNIIGGEWLTHPWQYEYTDENGSRDIYATAHPDFLWTHDRPEFMDFFSALKEIYEASTSAQEEEGDALQLVANKLYTLVLAGDTPHRGIALKRVLKKYLGEIKTTIFSRSFESSQYGASIQIMFLDNGISQAQIKELIKAKSGGKIVVLDIY